MKRLAFEAVAFTTDTATRTLRGMLLPFGQVSRPARDRATGKTGRYRFAAGSVTLPDNPADVVLNYAHDGDSLKTLIGVATELTITPEGVQAAFKIARTPEGDRILALADPETPVLKAFSAEVNGTFADPGRDGVQDAITTAIDGAAVVRIPAFVGAGITHVAASAATDQEEHMECSKCGVVHAAGVTECQPTAVPFSAAQGTDLAQKVVDLSTKVDELAEMKIPVEQLAQFSQLQVKEAPIYRFDGTLADSGHDFSTDFIAAVRDGDGVAGKRVMDFANASLMNPAGAPQFVEQADTVAVNPPKYRPDLFKDEEPALPSPMYDTFYAGAVTDNTPFFYSKLGTYALDTAAHVEGVEPTEGSFNTVAGATITPSLESGRFGLTREVIDQGGNPQVSGMIWNKVLRTHRLKLEAIAANAVKSKLADYDTLALVTPGAAGAEVGKAIKGGLVDLRFTADGQRFTKFFAAKALYGALADAEDNDGRPLYPIMSPSNADGTTAAGLGSINVAGIKLDPTWSTSPGDASFYVDPQAVKVWNSGLSRLDRVKETAAGYFIDFWFYKASHVYDQSGVLKLSYTEA